MRAERRTRWATRGSAVGALALAGILAAGPAVGEPTKANPVASLINQIADVDQTLTDLAGAVAVKQEGVNRALVDFQNAVAAQQVAVSANNGAKKSLQKMSGLVEDAQREFDRFVRSMQRQGNNRGAMTRYVASDDPQQVLDHMTAVDQVTQQQQQAIRRLQVARNQQANRVAATEATKRQTAAAAANASQRRDDAVNAYRAAQNAVRDQQTKRAGLLRQRDDLAAKLARLKGTKVSDKKRGGDPASDIAGAIADGVDKGLESIPEKPVAGDDALAQAAQAAAQLASNTGQALLASLIGEQQIPHSQLLDELGIGGSSLTDPDDNAITRLGTGSLGSLFGGTGGDGAVSPGLRGPQAIELVINRMKSQLGVTYAWGGGDANGPTLGIRDGGVADSYGDYQKVGFDCSGLMIYGFAGVGIDLPHYTGYQYTSGPQVPLSEMKRGDMIFYGPNASAHVALILGDGTMIEAPQSGSVVKISPVRTAGAMPMVVRLL